MRTRVDLLLPMLSAVTISGLLLGCGSSPETLPGNPAEYRRLRALTDCGALRAELKKAKANYQREVAAGRKDYQTITESYVTTVETQMKRMDCK